MWRRRKREKKGAMGEKRVKETQTQTHPSCQAPFFTEITREKAERKKKQKRIFFYWKTYKPLRTRFALKFSWPIGPYSVLKKYHPSLPLFYRFSIVHGYVDVCF